MKLILMMWEELSGLIHANDVEDHYVGGVYANAIKGNYAGRGNGFEVEDTRLILMDS